MDNNDDNNIDIIIGNNWIIHINNGTIFSTKKIMDICSIPYNASTGMCIILSSYIYDDAVKIWVIYNSSEHIDFENYNNYDISDPQLNADLRFVDNTGFSFFRFINKYILGTSCDYISNVTICLCHNFVRKHVILSDIFAYAVIDKLFCCGPENKTKLMFHMPYIPHTTSLYNRIFEKYYLNKKCGKCATYIFLYHKVLPNEIVNIIILYFCQYIGNPRIKINCPNNENLYLYSIY